MRKLPAILILLAVVAVGGGYLAQRHPPAPPIQPATGPMQSPPGAATAMPQPPPEPPIIAAAPAPATALAPVTPPPAAPVVAAAPAVATPLTPATAPPAEAPPASPPAQRAALPKPPPEAANAPSANSPPPVVAAAPATMAPVIAAAPALPVVAIAPHTIHDPPPGPPEERHSSGPSSFGMAAAGPPGRGPGFRLTPPQPSSLSGPARPLGGVALSLAGRPVELFGVRSPAARASCAVGSATRPCAEAAREALAARLGGRPTITCHSPPGQGGRPGYVCHDAAGTDLAGFLVSQGLALADTGQSYQYFGAEGAARSARRGLWHER